MPKIKHTGTRRRIREDLNEDLFFRPRRYPFKHAVKYYFDEARAKKPVCALHMLARFSEEMMFRARYGSKKSRLAIKDATELYNAVRHAEFFFIQGCHVGDRLRDTAPLSRKILRLQALAKTVYEAIRD